MRTQKRSEGREHSTVTRKDGQCSPKPSKEIVPQHVNNVKLLLGDFDDAWKAFQQREHGVTNLLGFLAWFHEELEAAGAFGEVGA